MFSSWSSFYTGYSALDNLIHTYCFHYELWNDDSQITYTTLVSFLSSRRDISNFLLMVSPESPTDFSKSQFINDLMI